jgi:hypothetical protein
MIRGFVFDDVYTQAGEYLDTAELRVEHGRRQTLLKFDLTHVPAAIQAELHYTIGSDAGAGRINLHLGSHTDWPNDTQSANNAPSSMAVLGSAQGLSVLDTAERVCVLAASMRNLRAAKAGASVRQIPLI